MNYLQKITFYLFKKDKKASTDHIITCKLQHNMYYKVGCRRDSIEFASGQYQEHRDLIGMVSRTNRDHTGIVSGAHRDQIGMVSRSNRNGIRNVSGLNRDGIGST